MFEREIQYITDFTLNKIRRLGSFFKLSDIAETSIHPALLQYISADLDYLIFLDRQRLLNKSLFDYSGREIQQHFSAISNEIKRNKLLPYEEIKKIVQQAVTFNVNFLLRPRWTMKRFVYDNEDFKNSEELQLLFNYCYYYAYYKHYILRFLEKRNLTSLSLPDFSERINLLTKELLQEQFNPVISSSMDDVVAFISFGDAVKTKISLEMVEVFLVDRKLEHLGGTLRLKLGEDVKQKYDVEEIKSIILTSYLPGQMEFDFEADDLLPEEEMRRQKDPEQETFFFDEEEVKVTTPVVDVEKFFIEEPLPAPGLPLVPETPDTPPALDTARIEAEELLPEKQEETGTKSPAAQPSDSSDAPIVSTESILEEIKKANEILKINLPEPAPAAEPAQEAAATEVKETFGDEIPDFEAATEPPMEILQEVEESLPAAEVAEESELFNYFTTKETMKIIASVFRNDSIDFVNSVERIAGCTSLEEASSIMRSIFYAYNISPVSNKEAVMLEERVHQYFKGRQPDVH